MREKLKRIPKHISLKLIGWARDIEIYGLKKVRLSKGYRAIYIEKNENQLFIIETLEVHKHDY